ncbi:MULTISPECIES: TIGR03936 family radical SAM-associated protein [unclassified Butyrivibrio]|uniref:TIGR03936 family radical SAM-associated protein n=1 Tax=unclassified Butyrivibrio TaxID=2639466 RepID=UPI0009DC45D7|nr:MULTISPECIES: TIGR03936 family radical SAM-associated protein [unclassified Butyrivibrio]
MEKLRLKFSKHGPIRFLGHLDVMRYVQKAIRRAEIDIKYSEGLSPHQILSFAQPLSVGSTTDGDYIDMTVNSLESPEAVMDALNEVMNEGIVITAVTALPEKAVNAMTSVAAAEYLISFREGKAPKFDLEDTMKAFMEQPEIPAIKKTKNGEKTIDIKPLIFKYEILDNKIHLLLSAGSANNLKAALFIESLYSFAGEEMQEFAAVFHRVETYLDGEDEKGHFVQPMIPDKLFDYSFAAPGKAEMGKIYV